MRPNAQEDPHRYRPLGDQQERPRRCADRGRPARRCSANCCPAVQPLEHKDWLGADPRLDGRRRRARHRATRTWATGCLAAHVIHDMWKATGGDAIMVTDVGQHQMWEAQYYLHERPHTLITSGGLGTMGFGLPGGDWRDDGPARRTGLGHRRRWRLPDDDVRTGDGRAGARRRSRSPSSTTATWAWCASGRSSSTRNATTPRPCCSPISSSWPRPTAFRRGASRRRDR